jgi:hypothetical protein
MIKKIQTLLIFFLMLISYDAISQVKFGTNPSTVNGSALLELESTNKGFLPPRMTTAQRDAISSAATGLVIYNTTINCYQVNFGTPSAPDWNCLSAIKASTNGTGDVSGYDCTSGTQTGSLSTGIAALGVSKTIVATVTKVGTYDISAIANGVSFRATGAFTTTGTQDIVMYATGTPITSGTSTFTLNTSPNCSFSMVVNDGSSNGTAVLTNFNCNTANAGNMTVGQSVSGVTQTITVDCSTAGTYNISATANGVTFFASGTIAVGTGINIVLTATGTPLTSGFHTYTLNTNPGCSFNRNHISTPTVTILNCSGATITGALLSGASASGVFVSVPYTSGNGINYNGQLINSTGVTGLTASLAAGTLANGCDGDLIFTITGTPANIGTASFALTFGGQSCTFTLNVNAPAAIASLDCSGSTAAGTLSSGTAASGVTQSIPYTGGNGGSYSTISISSAGVSGLTATAAAGSVANGTGSLVLTITGTPATSGTASFTVTFAGQTCSFTRTVVSPPATVTGLCISTTFSPSSAFAASAFSGTATVGYTGGNGATYSAGSGISSTGVTGLTATLQAGTLATGAGNLTYSISGTPSAAGTATFAINFGGQSCSISIAVTSLSGIVPANLTLAQNQKYFIASIYDQNYLPYSAPTGTASTTRPSNPDGTNESTTINVQGSLTTTGVNIRIPVTATGSGTLAAFSGTVNVPSSLTEDGISRNVTLSWASQAYTSSTKTIVANIKSVSGTLNALKLDINVGVGNDALGILLGQIAYPYNASGSASYFSLRDIAGIPDRMFGVADNSSNATTHLMLYKPVVAEDGREWLNLNLGAAYANINHGSFNVNAQASSSTDFLAFGNYFEWGRKPDGHELTSWTCATCYSFTYGSTTTKSNNPSHSLYITGGSPYNWQVTFDPTLWDGVNATNNPCPFNYRLATTSEWNAWATAGGVTTAATGSTSSLKLTTNGYLHSSVRVQLTGSQFYWAGDAINSGGIGNYWGAGTANTNWTEKTAGVPVRCIKN